MRLRELWVVAAGFAALTILLTWPQVQLLGTAVGPHYDALFGVWRLAWVAHALAHQPAHLFDANIFHPERGTLAYSDAALLPGFLAAPALWLGADPMIVYNLLVLGSFVGSGAAMYLLVRHLTGSRAAAWFAGIAFAFQPYRIAHYPQIELLWDWPIPLALYFLDRLLSTHRVRDGVRLGLALACQALSSLYYFVFLTTAIAIVAITMATGRRRDDLRATVKPFIAALAAIVALVGPYALAYRAAARSIGLRRAQDVADWSPRLGSYLVAPASNWLHGGRAGAESLEMMLFPGVVALGMAVAGLSPPIDRRRVAYLTAAIVAFDLSLGVHGIGGAWVFQHVLVYRGLRVPARMFVIAAAMIAVLAGYGIARLVRPGSRLRHAVVAALFGGVVLESTSVPLPLLRVDRPAPLYSWLRDQPPSPVAEWPVPQASSLGVTRAPWYMYYSTYHWQPLVNGYSGFYPLSQIKFVEAMEDFPSKASIDYLRRTGVRFVILHAEPDERAYTAVAAAVDASGAFEPVRANLTPAGAVSLYRLKY